MSHNHQKKIAIINDFSGFGKCSIAVSLPIISHMKIQCCPVPTSIFSNHTGFPHFFFDDYTDKMEEYISHWKQLNLEFNGITTGFLGSARQIQIVKRFIEDFRVPGTIVLIDPVMGDNGKAYSTYTPKMCEEMKKLVSYADILTPNVTEACILTDTPYQEHWHKEQLFEMAEKLIKAGAGKIVISGVSMGQFIGNVIQEAGQQPQIVRRKRIGHERSGTGDIFSSIIAADAVNNVDFTASVRKASAFIQKCIEVTEDYDIPKTDGVAFEDVLSELKTC